MDRPDLSGQTVLVTGSASGVGRELVLGTADCGAKTAVHYNTSADAADDVAELADERGGEDVENSDEFPDELPRDRPAAFEDLVRALWFFLEPTNDYVSGQNLEVDGGWLPETV